MTSPPAFEHLSILLGIFNKGKCFIILFYDVITPNTLAMLLFVPLQYSSYKRHIFFKNLLDYIYNKDTEICVTFWIESAQTKYLDLYCYYWKQYLAQHLWTALTLSMKAVCMSLPMATASVDKLKSGKLND